MTVTIRNLTAEPVRLVDETGTALREWEPEQVPTTLSVETLRLGVLPIADGVEVPVTEVITREVLELPPPEAQVLYIVPEQVAHAQPDARDVVYPASPRTDDKGNITGYQELRRCKGEGRPLSQEDILRRVEEALSGLAATTAVWWEGDDARTVSVTLDADPPFPLDDVATNIKSRVPRDYAVIVKHGGEEVTA